MFQGTHVYPCLLLCWNGRGLPTSFTHFWMAYQPCFPNQVIGLWGASSPQRSGLSRTSFLKILSSLKLNETLRHQSILNVICSSQTDLDPLQYATSQYVPKCCRCRRPPKNSPNQPYSMGAQTGSEIIVFCLCCILVWWERRGWDLKRDYNRLKPRNIENGCSMLKNL